MGIFDDFSVNARTYAGKISQKADAAVEISRLKINEKSLQREISKSLKLLGAKVYKAYNTEDSNVVVDDDITDIRDMYDRLKSVRTQISELKNSQFTSFDGKSTEDKG